MDPQVALNVLSLIGGLGTPAFFIIKWILASSRETTTFERSQIIPTKEWLQREAVLNARIDALNDRLDKLREFYEGKLEAKEKEVDELRTEVADLRHKVKNVQTIQDLDAEVKKLEKEKGK